MPNERIEGLVAHLFRHAAGRIVSRLTRFLGSENLDLAEESVQAAFVRALETWPYRGLPENPEAWLTLVARNAALDRLRRESNLRHKLTEAAAEPRAPSRREGAFDDEAAMILMCCHPEIPAESRIALTLKSVSGFSIPEVARALLSSEDAAAQRVVRAKRLIRERGVRFALPPPGELDRRLPSALEVLYLMFNEGYSAQGGEDLTRADLCAEAIRLAEILASTPATERPEVHALAALMCLQASRLAARTGPGRVLVPLADQDRTLWDRALIERGLRHLEGSARGERVTAYHLEAGIAACHATVARSEETDWRRILSLYEELRARNPSPVVEVNRAVALAMVEGPEAALRELAKVADDPALRRYSLLPAVEGELWERAGRRDRAAACYRRALELPLTAPEQRFLESKLARLEPAM